MYLQFELIRDSRLFSLHLSCPSLIPPHHPVPRDAWYLDLHRVYQGHACSKKLVGTLIHQFCDRLDKFQGEEPIWYGKRASKGETEGECQGYDALRCLNAHNIAMQINHRRSKASAERNPQWDPFRPRCLRSDPILRSPPPSAIYRAVHLRMRRRGAGNDIQPI